MSSKFPSLVPALAIFLLPACLLAQGNSGGSQKKDSDDTPDACWASLQAATKPTPGNSASAAKGSNEQKTQIVQAADKSREAAANAKDFYTKYPTHANAEEARKIEAISELHGVKDGDDIQKTKALSVAKAFRDDRSHSVNARTEVALAADRLGLAQKIKGRAQG